LFGEIMKVFVELGKEVEEATKEVKTDG